MRISSRRRCGVAPTETHALRARSAAPSKLVSKAGSQTKMQAKKDLDEKKSILHYGSGSACSASFAADKKVKKGDAQHHAILKGTQLVCRRCKSKAKEVPWGRYLEKSSGFGVGVPLGDACARCWAAFRQGDYEVTTTWEMLADECLENSKNNEEFELSCGIQEGIIKKEWPSQSMRLVRQQTMNAKVCYRGLRPCEFANRFSCHPQQLGFKLQDLVHPDQTSFKGVLIRDDGSFGCVGVQYEFATSIAVCIDEVKLDEARRIRESQATELFGFFTAPSGEEDPNIKKLRLATLTVEEVEQAVAKLSANETPAVSAAGFDHAEDIEHHDGADAAEEQVVKSCYAGPTFKRSDTPRSLASEPPSAKKARLSGQGQDTLEGDMSGGGDQATRGLDADSACESDQERADPDGARVRSICLLSILEGNRVGHKRRRLREKADELLKNPTEENKLLAGRFFERLQLADTAEKVSSLNNIMVDDMEVLAKRVNELKPHVSAWPRKVQEALLARACSELGKQVFQDGVVDKLFSKLALWDFGKDTAGGEVMFMPTDFDPLAPTLCGIDASFKDKSAAFESLIMSHYIAPICRLADSGCKQRVIAAIEKLCSAVVGAPILVYGDDEEEHGDTCCRILQSCRCLLHLLDPLDVEYASDFDTLFRLTPDIANASASQLSLMPLLKSLPFWKTELTECKKKGATHTDTAKLIQLFAEKLAVGLSDATDLKAFWESVEPDIPKLSAWATKVREGTLTLVVVKLVSALDRCADVAIGMAEKTATCISEAERAAAHLAAAHAFLSRAITCNVVEHPRAQWHKAVKTCETAREALASLLSEFQFKPYIVALSGDALRIDEQRAECLQKIAAVRTCRNPDAPCDESVRQALLRILVELSAAIGGHPTESVDVLIEQTADVFQDILSLLNDMGGDSEDTSRMRSVWAVLTATKEGIVKIQTYRALGDDDATRALCAQGHDILKEIAGLHDICDKLLPKLSDRTPLKCSEAARRDMQSLLARGGPFIVADRKKQIQAFMDSAYDTDAADSCSLAQALGGKTDGGVWTEGLAENAPLKKCMSVAKKTINANRNTKLKHGLDKVKALVEAVEVAEKTFSLVGDATWRANVDASLVRGYTTIAEGLVLFHCTTLKATKLKAAIVKEEGVARAAGVLHAMHPAIIGLTSRAKELKSMDA